MFHFWNPEVSVPLSSAKGNGLRGGVLGGELTPELLGVGYIIGPRIASVMLAGGVLAYLVLTPLIFRFVGAETVPANPTTEDMVKAVFSIREKYLLYIGAGAVAAGGIISMLQALPMIFAALKAGLRDMTPGSSKSG